MVDAKFGAELQPVAIGKQAIQNQQIRPVAPEQFLALFQRAGGVQTFVLVVKTTEPFS